MLEMPGGGLSPTRSAKPMRRNRLLLTALFACSVAAHAAENTADQRCPKLPAASGFVWQYSRGPDFDVCHAENKDAAQLIGVYLGFAPSFHADPKLLLRDGKIGAEVVHWYKKQPKDGGFNAGAETLLQSGKLTSHIWLLAKDEASLDSLLKLAESLSFAGVNDCIDCAEALKQTWQ